MPDIDNTIALRAQAPAPIDVMGALTKAAQLRKTEADTKLQQQEYAYRQFQQDQNEGYRASEVNTLADAHAKHLAIQGQIGNVLANAKSLEDIKQAIKMSNDYGRKVDQKTEQHLLSAPLSTVQQYGENMQRAGQSSVSNIQQSGIPARNERRATSDMDMEGLDPNKPYATRETLTGVGPTQKQLQSGAPRASSGAIETAALAGVIGAVGRTPAQAVDDRFPSQSVFQPSIVKGPNGSVSSSVTPETQGLQQSAVERFKQMQDTASRAQGLHSQLDAIEHDNEVLNSAGWSSTGAGANAKMSAAKSINSLFETFGVKAPIDPTKVASWEGYNKQTIRAGFELARTLGGHQAESVVQSSVNATPNVENTYFGSKVITNSIRQAVQREVDMYNYALNKAKTTGSSFGAEAEFNAKYPPKLYSQTAIANAIPPESIQRLTSSDSPKTRAQFDAAFGKGMADFVLQRAQQ